MAEQVGLVPLRCVRCATPVPAQPDEVAWACVQCGQGLLLDEDHGLLPLEIHFADGIASGTVGHPYWVAEGQVTLTREAYGIGGRRSEEASRFWGQSHRFFVPAFTCTLDMMLGLGTRLLLQPPDLQPGSPTPFAPVTLSPQDMPALAEFVVVAVEAERSDKVKQVDFSLQLRSPELWILPPRTG